MYMPSALIFPIIISVMMSGAQAQETLNSDCLVENPSLTEATAPPPVTQLIGQVQEALRIVNSKISSEDLPKLKNVQILLQTALGTTAGGGIQFFIITLGGKVTDEETQTMEITLSPPPVSAVPEAASPAFAKALSQAILAAGRDAKIALKSEPKLDLAKLVATIGFTVKREGNVGGGLIFIPITLNFSVGLNKSQIHKVVVTFDDSK